MSETRIPKAGERVRRELKAFAHMATMALIGCRFCLELGYFMTHHNGLDVEMAREVPRWRDSDVCAPVERDVMEYAQATSQTPPTERRGSGGDVSAR